MHRVFFAVLMIVLVAAVALVFKAPRRRKRGAVEAESKPTAAPETTAPVEQASVAEPQAAAPSAQPVKPSAPRTLVKPSSGGEIPSLFTADPEEPATIVTRRFKPKAVQAFIAAVDLVDDGGSLPFGFILLAAVGRSDVGRRRKNNEDSYLVHPDEHVFAVADGMGGHAAGEIASNIAVNTMLRAFQEGRFDGTPTRERPRRADELVRAIQMANRAIYAEALTNPDYHGMGTTVVAARFAPTRQRVFIAHVGDSRCYRMRGGKLVQMTADHTMSAYGLGGRQGEMLTRAVGIGEDVEVDVLEDTPETDDQYLICSDGLTKMLDDNAIGNLLLESHDPEVSVRRLIEVANDLGGRDNITAIVMQVHATSAL